MVNAVELDTRDLSKLSEKEKVTKAIEFSEGNRELLDLLLCLWNNNINTYACCAGHEVETVYEGEFYTATPSTSPYLMFDARTIEDDKLANILRFLMINADIESFETGSDSTITNDGKVQDRRYITLYFKDYTASFKLVKNVFDSVLNRGFFADDIEISPEAEEFIGSAVALKNVDLKEIDLSKYKETHYKRMPKSVDKIDVVYNGQDKPEYKVFLDDNGMMAVTKKGIQYFCDCAFYEDNEGDFVVTDKEKGIRYLKPFEVEMGGFIDLEEYRSIIYELFEKDQEAFLSLLAEREQKAPQKQ